MKVSELKVALDELDDDLEIMIQKDQEGNGYQLLRGTDQGLRSVHENWYWETIWPTNEELDELIAGGKGGWSEEDRAPEDAVPCLILFP